ncbi:MAG TPA: hypothetical protein VJ741_12140 [Solirubrobacteraceae bacterium]|nr:hypothetical protein [Solirubrobacteraceae bacterium]
MKRTWWSMPIALCVAMAAAPGALAAGGPVAPVQNSYIGMAGNPYRYGAFDANGNTVVKEREAGAGPAVSGLRLHGHYGIPGIDYSGSMTGLSADGRTLILAHIPVGSPRTTRLLVLDTPQLAVRTRLTFPGWSTVDAISPDGRWLYLIHYPSSDLTKYEVLAYDLPAHRLLPQPVVDPRERDEAMTGIPINRVMGARGQWAYTLYMRPSGVPFIHALDTTHHRAVCIDLRPLANVDISSAHLVLLPGGTTLQVDIDGSSRAAIDTRTFRVSAGGGRSPASPVRSPARGHRATRRSSRVPWEAILLVSIAALGVIAAGGTRVIRTRRHPDYARGPDGAAIIHVDARPNVRTPSDDELPVA